MINIGNTQSNAVKHDLVLKAMGMLGYAASNLGSYEISSTYDFMTEACKREAFPLVSANLEGTEIPLSCIQKYIIKDINGIKIGITGILPEKNQSTLLDDRFKITDARAALNGIIPDLKSKTDFIILLSQFRATETQKIVEEFPDINIALCVDSIPVEITNPLSLKVMSIINRGKEIGILKIEKTDSDVIVKNVQRIHLDDTVEADPDMAAMVKESMDKIEQQKQKTRDLLERRNQKKIEDPLKVLELTPEEFIKQYNNN